MKLSFVWPCHRKREVICACLMAMPYKRLFANMDPVLELKKHNTTPLITRGKASKRLKSGANEFVLEKYTGTKKDRPKSRERSKTPDIGKWNREDSNLNDHNLSKKVNFSPAFSQSYAKPVMNPSKTKSRTEAPSKRFDPKATTHRAFTMNSRGRKSGETPTDRPQASVKSRRRSLSVPPDPGEKYSISTIVKARSLAMKWRGKNGRMGRRHTVLSTITDDSTKFSLCANVKCSPQFEAVIKILQDDNPEDVDDTLKSFELFKID